MADFRVVIGKYTMGRVHLIVLECSNTDGGLPRGSRSQLERDHLAASGTTGASKSIMRVTDDRPFIKTENHESIK